MNSTIFRHNSVCSYFNEISLIVTFPVKYGELRAHFHAFQSVNRIIYNFDAIKCYFHSLLVIKNDEMLYRNKNSAI